MSRVLYRAFVVFLSMALAYSSAWAGVNTLILNLSGFAGGLVQTLQGIPKLRGPGAKPIFRGANPKRDPKGRGGRWKLTERQKLANVAWKMGRPGHSEPPLELMFASMVPSAYVLQDVGGGEAGGDRLEGEGGYTPASGAFGGLNTNTGNLLKSYGIVGWSDVGQADVGLTLFHNSMANGQESEFGSKWSFTYGMTVVEDSGTAFVKWDDGTIVPYALNSGGHGEREGFFSSIQKSGTSPNVVWTLTAQDQTRYILNNSGLLTAIKDRNNNQVTINRNSSGQITTVHGPTSARTLTFTYNSNGYVSQVQDYSGRIWEFTYNSGNLTQIKYPRPTGTGSYPIRYFGYDNWTDSRITEETDLRAKLWFFNYDSNGQLANATDPESNMTIFWYTTTSTTIELPGEQEIVHNYSEGLLASEVDAEGHSISYSNYNTNKQAGTINDRRNNNWTYTYSSGGDVASVSVQKPHGTRTWTYAYNDTNDLTTATDPEGHSTTYGYDTNTPCKGRLLTVVDGENHTVLTNTYNSLGQLETSKDALNRTTTYTYTSYGEVDTVEAPNGAVTDFTYDTLGRVTEITDEDANNWQFEYDYWNRRTLTVHPDASDVNVAYDWGNNVTSVTDENGHTTTATYDDANRKTTVTNAESETETYTYNSNSWITHIQNGRGKTRDYEYTDRGELYRMTMPDGTKEVYTYDYNGNLVMYTVPKTVGNLLQIEYVYDNANRLEKIDYDNQTDTTFEYDDADRRIEMVDSTGTTTWGYDDADRLTSYAVGSSTTTFGYNNAGQRTSMVEPGSGSPTTTYNYSSTTGQLTSIVNPYSETTSFTYDALGRLDKKTLANGTREEYTYDVRSRVTDIVLKGGSGYATTVRSQNYTYDNASNVLTHTTGGVTTTYGYDDIDQLISESRSGYSASYSYDGNGNRLTRTVNGTTEDYAYDDADKLLTVKIGTTTIKSFTYDEAGRTTRQTTRFHKCSKIKHDKNGGGAN